MNDIKLSTFPSNKFEALTMLYLQNQNLSDISTEQLVEKYNQVYTEIKKAFSKDKAQNINY